MRDWHPTVTILASRRNGMLDIGVTTNIRHRIHRHREGLLPGFTRDYGVKRLVWFEVHAEIGQAVLREKQRKKWRRAWTLQLIEQMNSGWRDLAEGIGFAPLSEPEFRPDGAGSPRSRG
jgi:putative endonuclease